jgi:hypothetical protein
MVAGALLCFGLRAAAIRRGWQLPVAEFARPGPAVCRQRDPLKREQSKVS